VSRSVMLIPCRPRFCDGGERFGLTR
jgi:hypothetical protein